MSTETQQDRRRELDKRLSFLWRRRCNLSRTEWEELYHLVFRCLRGKCRDLLQRLPGTDDDYFQDFFTDKVFLTAGDGGEIYHSGALVSFFSNYLIDRYRALPPRSQSLDGEEAESNQARHELINQLVEEALATIDQSHVGQLLDLVEIAMASGRPHADVTQAFRVQLGIDLDAITDAAWCFLDAGEGWEGLRDQLWWIRLYLTRHFCPEDDSRLSLVELSRRHQIPSYYSRAVKLGINVPKQDDAAMSAFTSSYRGRWLARLAIPVDAAHRVEIMVALKILCVVALNQLRNGGDRQV